MLFNHNNSMVLLVVAVIKQPHIKDWRTLLTNLDLVYKDMMCHRNLLHVKWYFEKTMILPIP